MPLKPIQVQGGCPQSHDGPDPKKPPSFEVGLIHPTGSVSAGNRAAPFLFLPLIPTPFLPGTHTPAPLSKCILCIPAPLPRTLLRREWEFAQTEASLCQKQEQGPSLES